MKQAKRILIVDDDEDILTAGRLLLKRHYQEVVTCNRPEKIPHVLRENTFDAVLLDMNFSPGESSGKQGFAWLKRILELDPQAVVVMITAHGSVDIAVQAMKHGAVDFITKPWENEKVIAVLSAAVEMHRGRPGPSPGVQQKKVDETKANDESPGLLGHSPAMQAVHSMLRRAGPTEANVLILGENGTGKELAARELHRRSLRAHKAFTTIDLGAVAESLFESELFGHKKGAFTGADRERTGRLVQAHGGTLFLDEIGNLPLHLQAKLLTVLEQRKVTPLGESQAVDIDVRVVAATNLNPETLRNEQMFRQDLLFRLNTVEIEMPPLRRRAEDIPEIVAYYAAVYARRYGRPERVLSAQALQAASGYHWPGNVRALRHAVERAVILCEGEHIEAADLQLNEAAGNGGLRREAAQATGREAPADLNLERTEKRNIEIALKRHQYNISKAAAELGLTRASLYRRMEKHGL